MVCVACGRMNPGGSRFCGGCGAGLAALCSRCGHRSQPDARFCQSCGAPLASPPAEDSTRKVVTIVFADLVDSTPLQERLDPESTRRFMDRYYEAMRGAVEAEGGVVTELLGDGVKAVFGVPRVREDDALRAVRAAVEMQRAFAELARAEAGRVGPTGLRIAVNTGEVVASAGRDVIGDPVNVAGRLQAEARVGDVVIAEPTRRLVAEHVTLAPLGSFSVKGRSERVSAHRVVSLERPGGASTTPFVGREEEIRSVLAAFDEAVAARRARLAVVLGSPGLGKSRLVAEIGRRLGGRATVLAGRCNPERGSTFAPVAGALRAHLGLEETGDAETLRDEILPATRGADEAERARIASGLAALLSASPASSEETFFVVRRFLSGLASEQPVVLVIDDLHWGEPLLLDLVEHLVQWATGAPLLVLAGARPELREARSALTVRGRTASEVVTLSGLDAAAATRLAANAIGADELPAAVVGRVLTASEGNPLFVGELVRMLVREGALRREGERWTTGAALAALEMPPTIQALLAARIERLRPEERAVLERAAVVGRHFSRSAVAALMPGEVDLDRQLEALQRSELVEADPGWFLGEPALRFHHALIRDAAYRRVLKNRRAELHEHFAEWVTARLGDAPPYDETIGWHLEQAHQCLAELGALDASGCGLGERAARYLGAAGRRALERDDLPAAASLLGRAVACLDPASAERAELALDWCEALLSAGEVATAATAIDELGRFADASPRLRAWHICFAAQRAALTDPESLRATAERTAHAAAQLAAEGDSAGEAKGHLVHALALARLGRVDACLGALDRGLAAARRAEDRRRANTILAAVPLAALWGPSPVTRASGRCLDVVRVLRITHNAPAVEAVALRCQALLEALRGRSDAAQRMLAASRRMVEELGITQRVLEADVFAGQIELIHGDAAAAERSLRQAYEGLRELGLGTDAAQAAALLGRALLALGRDAEAEALSYESERLAGDDLQASIAWRGVRAEALARRGEQATAVDLARAAVSLSAATDALLFHADARLALSAALRAAGRHVEADAESSRALELWEAKGATLLVERARGSRSESARGLDGGPRARGETQRRVAENLATTHLARIDQAVAAGDLEAVRRLLGDTTVLDHTAGRTYGTDALNATFRWMVDRSADLSFGNEVLAALGPSLALTRWLESASGSTAGDLPIGAFETEGIVLLEADPEARSIGVNELFEVSRLDAAITRLYERYAEQHPQGAARERAAEVARSCAALLGAPDPRRLGEGLAPDFVCVDHRTRGVDPIRGRDAVAIRCHEVLALSQDALLVSCSDSRSAPESVGGDEGRSLWLANFGGDGRVARVEVFAGDSAAHALARFDALAERPPEPAPVRRRLRGVASAHVARMNSALATRDMATIRGYHADGVRVVYPSGDQMDRAAVLNWWAQFLDDREASLTIDPLAELGDSVALSRLSWSGSASSDPSLEIGRFEGDELDLVELDADGRAEHIEIFAVERLGEAMVRLYERYAHGLPPGPARERAAAVARSVAAQLRTPFDLERIAATLEPEVELIDHQLLPTMSAHGAAEVCRNLQSWLDLAPDAGVAAVEDILALDLDGLLARVHLAGTVHDGGAFDARILFLLGFGASGRIGRVEIFEDGDAVAALARFETWLKSASPRRSVRRVPTNAATEALDRLQAAIAARDARALSDAIPESRVVHHPSGLVYDREAVMNGYLGLIDAAEGRLVHEPLGTLGESLALCRHVAFATGARIAELESSAMQRDLVLLLEVDAGGGAHHAELFAPEHLGDALVRAYERYAERMPDGPKRAHAATVARSLSTQLGQFDPTSVGDVLGLAPSALLLRVMNSPTQQAGGGREERSVLVLFRFGLDGRIAHVEQVDVERVDSALARFDALVGPRLSRRVRENAATGFAARANAASDGEAFAARHVEAAASGLRQLLGGATAFGLEPLATLGEALALARQSSSGAYALIEIDRRGEAERVEVFPADRLDRAVAQLYERHAERLPVGAARERALAIARAHRSGGPIDDVQGWSASLAPDVSFIDHRPAGLPGSSGPEALLRLSRSLQEVAHGLRQRNEDVLALGPDGHLSRRTVRGTDRSGGGAFENELLVLRVYGADGRLAHREFFAPDQAPLALARYDALTSRAAAAADRTEPIVSLGDSFALARDRSEGGDAILLTQTDGRGRALRTERFAPDRLGDAVARLYALLAESLPEGPERASAAATAGAVSELMATGQAGSLDSLARAFSPGIEIVDRRLVGSYSAQGAEAALLQLRSLQEMSDDFRVRDLDVHAARPDALVVRRRILGTGRTSGDAHERGHASLWVFGDDGRLARWEMFDEERVADALARFDALGERR